MTQQATLGCGVFIACVLGAAIAWKPADSFYTESRQRHIGTGYLAKIENPDLSKEQLDALTRQAIFERRLFPGIVTAIWGAAVCGLIGAFSSRPRSLPQRLVGLVSGIIIGAAVGVVAGFAGQFAAEKYPTFRFDSSILQISKTMGYHAIIYGLLGIASGITFGLLSSRHLSFAASLSIGLLGGIASALVFTPLVSVIFPLTDTTYVIPPGSYPRLLWFEVPAVLIGAALCLADRPRALAKAQVGSDEAK